MPPILFICLMAFLWWIPEEDIIPKQITGAVSFIAVIILYGSLIKNVFANAAEKQDSDSLVTKIIDWGRELIKGSES